MKNIIVWDTETGGIDIKKCELLEIACLAINPISLKIIPGSEFVSLLKPKNGGKLEDGVIDQKALDVNGKTLAELKNAPDRKLVLKKFVEHVKKFGKGWQKPYSGGKNIRTFDMPILDRVLQEEGLEEKGGLFDNRVQFDIEDDLIRFFGHDEELPNIKMDTIRTYFGMSTDSSHSALFDVQQTAWLIVKYLKLYREFRNRIKFKDSAKSDGGILLP